MFEGSIAPTGARNHYYVCLRCPDHPLGFYTTNLARYTAQLQDSRGEFHDHSVSYGFSTRADGSLLGWLRPAMASIATGMKGLSREALVALATAISPDRVLPALLIGLAPGSDGQPRWCQSYLVRIRHQGFMVICPDEDQLHEALVERFGEAEDEGALFFTGQIDLTSMRGKALGQVTATLLDPPWAAAQSFIRHLSLRGAAAREATISRFVFEEQAGRPLTSSVLDLAQSWITTHMEEEAAQEYATAAEDDELVPVTPMWLRWIRTTTHYLLREKKLPNFVHGSRN